MALADASGTRRTLSDEGQVRERITDPAVAESKFRFPALDGYDLGGTIISQATSARRAPLCCSIAAAAFQRRVTHA